MPLPPAAPPPIAVNVVPPTVSVELDPEVPGPPEVVDPAPPAPTTSVIESPGVTERASL